MARTLKINRSVDSENLVPDYAYDYSIENMSVYDMEIFMRGLLLLRSESGKEDNQRVYYMANRLVSLFEKSIGPEVTNLVKD